MRRSPCVRRAFVDLNITDQRPSTFRAALGIRIQHLYS
jgi:hypothetical protein